MTPGASSGSPHLFLSCGEASGERYGVALARALQALEPDIRLSGLGGQALADAGVALVARSDEIAVMGFGDVARALPRILRIRRRVRHAVAADDLDGVVPVDFPGFNLDIAARAKKSGRPVYFVVAPQLWAWGSWRLGQLRRSVDRLGTLLPFEAAFFSERGITCDALGHPLIEDYSELAAAAKRVQLDHSCSAQSEPLRIGLLPGSRRQEVTALVPVLAAAAEALCRTRPERNFQWIVSSAPGVDSAWLTELKQRLGAEITTEPMPQLLPRLDLALVCSGTASLEATLAGVPHSLVYRTSALNYALGRTLVGVDRVGLANLILDRDVVREFLQGAARAQPLADDLDCWIRDRARRQRYGEHVRILHARLGSTGFWERTAASILALIRKDAPSV